MEQRKCVNCGKLFDLTLRKIRENVLVCGISCRNKYYVNSGKKHWNYKNGISLYRDYIKKDHCELCNSKKNLLVHHKNENREDNSIENLLVVCKKCHQNIHCTKDNITGKYIKK